VVLDGVPRSPHDRDYIDPAVWLRTNRPMALAGTVFRLLQRHASASGSSRPELGSRRVRSRRSSVAAEGPQLRPLLRIAYRFDLPRAWMGLRYDTSPPVDREAT